MEMYGIDQLGIQASQVHHNLCAARLVKKSLERGEATLSSTGALSVETGKYTGRSPYDKYIVDSPAVHDRIHWGSVNRPIDRSIFNRIKGDMIEYLNGKEVFVFDGFAGADSKYTDILTSQEADFLCCIGNSVFSAIIIKEWQRAF